MSTDLKVEALREANKAVSTAANQPNAVEVKANQVLEIAKEIYGWLITPDHRAPSDK